MNRVSILIAAYNAADTIVSALDSCLSDEIFIEEIVVVDDGSTDSTAGLTQAWSLEHDIRLELIQTENRGGCAARNTAIASSKGESLLWLDADDLLAPGKVELVQRLAQTHPHHLSCTPWTGFHSQLPTAAVPAQEWSRLPADSSPADWLARDIHAVPHCYGGRRALFEQAGPWDESLQMNQDGEYFARVIAGSQGVIFSPTPHVFYRQSPSGSVSHFTPAKAESLFRSIESMQDTALALEDSPRMRQTISNRWQHFIYTTYPHAKPLRREAQLKLNHLPTPRISNPNAVSPISKAVSLILGWRALTRLRLLRNRLK
jgi:glycosyltransferase involved in cell wall biosynthesis